LTLAPPVSDKRTRLIEAAQRVMSRRGVAGATTKEIAAEAGVAEGTIYNHFADKIDLCLAVVLSRADEMFRHLPAESGKRSVRSVLIEVVEERLSVTAETIPLMSAVVGDPALAAQFRERIALDLQTRAPFDAVADYIAREQEAGRIGRDIDPRVLTRLLLGCAFHHSFMTQAVGEERLEVKGRRFVEELVDAALRAAGPAGSKKDGKK
jgi:AcrR family transcriptional regulator